MMTPGLAALAVPKTAENIAVEWIFGSVVLFTADARLALFALVMSSAQDIPECKSAERARCRHFGDYAIP